MLQTTEPVLDRGEHGAHGGFGAKDVASKARLRKTRAGRRSYLAVGPATLRSDGHGDVHGLVRRRGFVLSVEDGPQRRRARPFRKKDTKIGTGFGKRFRRG